MLCGRVLTSWRDYSQLHFIITTWVLFCLRARSRSARKHTVLFSLGGWSLEEGKVSCLFRIRCIKVWWLVFQLPCRVQEIFGLRSLRREKLPLSGERPSWARQMVPGSIPTLCLRFLFSSQTAPMWLSYLFVNFNATIQSKSNPSKKNGMWQRETLAEF